MSFFSFILLIIVIAILRSIYTYYEEKNYKPPTQTKRKTPYSVNFPPKDDPLKAKGDEYERWIGKQFEEKGNLVIYNGFINGYKDKGVDIIVVSHKAKTINLVQCKNWTLRPINIIDIQNIYEKLLYFKPCDFYKINIDNIAHYHQIQQDKSKIEEMMNDVQVNVSSYKIRKTLYASSDKVVDLDVGKHLKVVGENIFRYEDMKIVIHSTQ